MKRILFFFAFATASLSGQTINTNCTVHPRLILTDCVPYPYDTVTYPGGGTNGRLAAVSALALASSGQAHTDFLQQLSIIGPQGTSTTSATVATGSITLTTQASVYAFCGPWAGNPANCGTPTILAISNGTGEYFAGPETAYNYSTGVITLNVNVAVGSGTHADWTLIQVPALNQHDDNGADLNYPLMFMEAYAIYEKAAQHSTANVYAAAVYTALTSGGAGSPVYVTSYSGNGTTMTLTLPSTSTLTSGQAGIWGFTNDLMNGAFVQITVVDSSHVTYASSVSGSGSGGGVAMVTQAGAWIGGIDQHNHQSLYGSQWAYMYDWCYPWMAAQGHLTFARDQMKQAFWNSSATRGSSQWNNQMRDSDFHNYPSQSGIAAIEIGTAMLGDDSTANLILAEGVGYLITGLPGVLPAAATNESGPQETVTLNVSVSNSVLVGGYMNWEGSSYFRNSTQRIIRALKAYDDGTGKANGVFTGPYANAANALWYLIYAWTPAGTIANFGDSTPGTTFSGKDQITEVLLADSFPDPHATWFVDNAGGSWYDGNNFPNLLWKLPCYPYINGPGSHDFTDLPLSRKMGPDIVIRSGWGPHDTYINYTRSLSGTYHRHDDYGSFGIFKENWIIVGEPYNHLDLLYDQYGRRTQGAPNALTVYNPADCWEDVYNTCGLGDSSSSMTKLMNDGGALWTKRRYQPQFSTQSDPSHQVFRIWSGTVYSDSTPLGSSTIAGVYKETAPIVDALFASGTGYEHIWNDLTAAYVNSYSGSGDNPSAKIACVAAGGVCTQGYVRELTHFQPLSGGAWNPLVVVDRVTSTNSSFLKSVGIHVPNPVTVNGTLQAPGDTGQISSATQVQTDSSPGSSATGRLFITNIAPSSPSVRVVGGTTCANQFILGATNANPAVLYIPNHGMTAGESVYLNFGLYYGTGGYGYQPWLLDSSLFPPQTVAAVIDSDHISLLGVDSTSWPSWSSAFISGAGAPTGSGSSWTISGISGPGTTTYYQTDAASGETVWRWTGSAWQHITNNAALTSPAVSQHTGCQWEYYTDQLGPQGSGGSHMWIAGQDPDPTIGPNYKLFISPGSFEASDVMVSVYNTATTSTSAPPTITKISATGLIGAQIADGSVGYYVAIYPTSMLPQTSVSYASTHTGSARHVVGGLLPSNNYAVTQGGTLIASVTSDSSGAVPFTETGGGNFQVISTSPAQQPSVVSSGVNASGVIK